HPIPEEAAGRAYMKGSSARINLEYLRTGTEPLVLRANLPGEVPVMFHIETLASVRRAVEQQGWYAVPNLLILPKLIDTALAEAVADALEIERGYRYRSWRRSRASRPQQEPVKYELEYYGDPDSCQENGWIDIVVHVGDRDDFTLTVETPSS